MKDRKYIQQLLDRFMEGMTSEQEERQLADFFASVEDIPGEWRAYAIMFGGFQQKGVLKRQPAKVLPLKRWVVVAACAAGFVAFFLVLQRTVKDEQQLALEEPVVKEQQIAREDVPPAPETLVEDLVEVKSPVKPKKVHRPDRPQAELVQEETKQEYQSTVSPEPMLSEDLNIHLIAAAQARDIRSRGERLSQEVALLIEQ